MPKHKRPRTRLQVHDGETKRGKTPEMTKRDTTNREKHWKYTWKKCQEAKLTAQGSRPGFKLKKKVRREQRQNM